MENKYLFQGKRVDSGEWVYGDLWYCLEEQKTYIKSIINNTGDYRSEPPSTHQEDFKVIPESIGQCIEIKDKNGKLPYKDDLIQAVNYLRLFLTIPSMLEKRDADHETGA